MKNSILLFNPRPDPYYKPVDLPISLICVSRFLDKEGYPINIIAENLYPDPYQEIKDQAKFLEVVLHYKDLAEKAMSSGVELENVLGLSILEDIGRSKFEENMAELLDKYDKEMTKEFSKIMEGA